MYLGYFGEVFLAVSIFFCALSFFTYRLGFKEGKKFAKASKREKPPGESGAKGAFIVPESAVRYDFGHKKWDVILSNIDAYDGTAAGQKEV